ncbi:MAG TPA: indolepyruvate oxidoreductase subunit beta [Pyrinomonadaceae bacterium]|nr:indolepyruvate oxidoreductase subunit beta [Pyrinomonadaceae bacterium]
MKCDIIVAGVGGQGTLSVSSIIASAAMSEGLSVRQSEVHGMSQRGGGVVTNLRLSDQPIASDLIARGTASMILSIEPLEGLRYLDYLSPDGTLVSSSNPVVNIPDYPNLNALLETIRELPHSILVDGEEIARRSGSIRATNMVMVGAAAPMLPIQPETIERFIQKSFGSKGERAVQANIKAFRAGREATNLV